MARVQVFPAPHNKNRKLKASFGRKIIPGSNPPRRYARSALGCLVGDAGHGGIDIVDDDGSPALACIDGKVSYKDFGAAFGEHDLTIIAPDDEGNYTSNSEGFFYGHLSARLVGDGELVKAGQRIGLISAEGQATGAHIHFEHRRRWKEWCTAVDCHAELERARNLLQPITITIGGKELTVKVGCWLNDDRRPVIMVRDFLERLRIKGKKVQFEFHQDPPRLEFLVPANARDLPVHFFDGAGMALLREVIETLAPFAVIKPNIPAREIEITGGDLTIVN
jgi:murein DD-endopeptidase MepM/ murein hydrolase activator NlpD